MEDYRGRTYQAQLSNKQTVFLAEWGALKPTEHGEKLQGTPFDPRTGDRPKFYAATAEFMRNGGVPNPMHAENARLDHQSLRLFYFPLTKTWHAADALDTDHDKPWREHLEAKGVRNAADAAMAYNDVSNLRMAPSAYNRARTSADALIATYTADSPQWRDWVRERFGYDPSVEYPAFDPERDLARRTRTTTGQAWTDEHTRADLGFDKKVLDKWFNHALSQAHAGSVEMPNPETGRKDTVHLFRCAASGQLTTRDALDIDHAIPFEIIADKMRELFPNHRLSKADMLDVYNDTSNLRLVTRGANSSHEFELGVDGDWRDKQKPEKPGEFSRLMGEGPSYDERASLLIQEHFFGKGFPLPQPVTSEPVAMLIPRPRDEPDNLRPQSLSTLAAADAPLTDPASPYHGVYGKVSKLVDMMAEGDPRFYASLKHFNNGKNPAPGQIENISASLIAVAKEARMDRIDLITTNPERTTLFVAQGNGHGDVINRADIALRAAMQFTVEESTARVQHADRTELQRTLSSQQIDAPKQATHL